MIRVSNLVEVDIVIKWQYTCSPCIPQPSNGVAAYWQEDDCHVQLQGFSGAFCGCHAVAHHTEDVALAVLDELPGEEPSHYSNPQREHPQAFPVVLQIVDQRVAYFADGALLP